MAYTYIGIITCSYTYIVIVHIINRFTFITRTYILSYPWFDTLYFIFIAYLNYFIKMFYLLFLLPSLLLYKYMNYIYNTNR